MGISPGQPRGNREGNPMKHSLVRSFISVTPLLTTPTLDFPIFSSPKTHTLLPIWLQVHLVRTNTVTIDGFPNGTRRAIITRLPVNLAVSVWLSGLLLGASTGARSDLGHGGVPAGERALLCFYNIPRNPAARDSFGLLSTALKTVIILPN